MVTVIDCIEKFVSWFLSLLLARPTFNLRRQSARVIALVLSNQVAADLDERAICLDSHNFGHDFRIRCHGFVEYRLGREIQTARWNENVPSGGRTLSCSYSVC